MKFSETSDYGSVLNRLKIEFEKKWKENVPATVRTGSEFEEVCVLGSGAFGIVKLVKRKHISGSSNDDIDYFAMKFLSKEKVVKYKQINHTLNEKRILQSINFPFLVSMEKSYKDNTTLYIVMPFINGGELFTLLRKMRRFEEDHAKFYAAQVLLALEYLHHLHLIYRDLKPENIMVDSKGFLKITDFGFCKLVETRTYTLCGTPEYLAPEIIQGKPYGRAVDWWSFGILLYELLAGYSPFYVSSGDQMVLFDKIISGKFKFPSYFNADAKNLIQNILQTDLTKRFGNLKNGVQDIKGHAWFKGINYIAILNGDVPVPFTPKISGAGDFSNFDNISDEYNVKDTTHCMYEKEFIDF